MKMDVRCPIVFTGQKAMLETHAEDLWAFLCDEFAGKFTLREAAIKVAKEFRISERTAHQWVTVLLKNVQCAYVGASNPCPVRRYGKRIWDLLG